MIGISPFTPEYSETEKAYFEESLRKELFILVEVLKYNRYTGGKNRSFHNSSNSPWEVLVLKK